VIVSWGVLPLPSDVEAVRGGLRVKVMDSNGNVKGFGFPALQYI
jgi:hypothetical protein